MSAMDLWSDMIASPQVREWQSLRLTLMIYIDLPSPKLTYYTVYTILRLKDNVPRHALTHHMAHIVGWLSTSDSTQQGCRTQRHSNSPLVSNSLRHCGWAILSHSKPWEVSRKHWPHKSLMRWGTRMTSAINLHHFQKHSRIRRLSQNSLCSSKKAALGIAGCESWEGQTVAVFGFLETSWYQVGKSSYFIKGTNQLPLRSTTFEALFYQWHLQLGSQTASWRSQSQRWWSHCHENPPLVSGFAADNFCLGGNNTS